jgi:hypothetical protein
MKLSSLSKLNQEKIKTQETKNWVRIFEPEQSDPKDPFFVELPSLGSVQTEERESTLVPLTGNPRIEGCWTR